VATLQPMVEYSTRIFCVLFSTPLPILFFSTIPLPPHVFVCAHYYVLPFPCYSLQFFNGTICTHVVMNSKTLKMRTTANNKHKLLLTVTPFFSSLNMPPITFIFYSPIIF
jgi:hypothetical protein